MQSPRLVWPEARPDLSISPRTYVVFFFISIKCSSHFLTAVKKRMFKVTPEDKCIEKYGKFGALLQHARKFQLETGFEPRAFSTLAALLLSTLDMLKISRYDPKHFLIIYMPYRVNSTHSGIPGVLFKFLGCHKS